ADVDDGLARFNSDDLAFDNRTLFGGVNLKALFQEGFEFFHSVLSAHASFFLCGVFWPCGWLRRSLMAPRETRTPPREHGQEADFSSGCGPIAPFPPQSKQKQGLSA